MHVLILGARAPAALEWARAFRAAGWRVSAADSLRHPLTRASQAVDAHCLLPPPRQAYAAWRDALQRQVETHAVDLVLPCCEEVFYLAQARPVLPCRVVVSAPDLLHRLHHKFHFAELTAGWPASAPLTRLLTTSDACAAYRDDADAWVFKPVYSRFACQTRIRPDRRTLAAIRPSPAVPWVAQRFIAGRELCSYSVLVDGRVTAHACYQPRYRAGRGAGIWFEPVVSATITDFVTRFGDETGFCGQVGFDFIEDPDGRCHVLECNPRATSGVHLFDDQPAALVAALTGSGGGTLCASTAPRMVALAMLLFASPRQCVSRAYWRDFRAARDVVTRPGDRGVLFGQGLALLELAARAVRLRRGLLAASTADIEWDGPLSCPLSP